MEIKAIGNTAQIVKKAKNATIATKSPLKSDIFVRGIKKGAKVVSKASGIGLGVLLFATAGMVIKDQIDKAAKRKHTPEELRNLFNSVKNKEGEEFIDSAYAGLVKYYGLEEIAPEKVNLNAKEDGVMTVTGGFNPIENTIGYSKGFSEKIFKKDQISLLSHELQHMEQFNLIMRTEGLGFEALADAWAESAVNNATVMLCSNWVQAVKKQYPPQEASKIIADKKEEVKAEFLVKLRNNYPDIDKMPKISKDSKEGKRAYKYAEAVRNYEGLGMFGFGSEKYENNLIEKEAYAQGDKMAEIFSNFV